MEKASNLIIYRCNVSGYQAKDFKQQEKEYLNSISGLSYSKEITPEINCLITTSNTVIEELPKDLLSRLKLIIHPNSGYDNFAKHWVQQCQFPIILGNPIRAQAVAQYSLSCLFHSLQPPFRSNWDPSRNWSRQLLKEKKILLLGNGHIGKIIEQALTALQANLSIYDPLKGKDLLDLEDVDIVINAAALTPDNRNMINKDFLTKLSKNFILINGARGKHIVVGDLIEVLNERPKARAYLDVFQNEPFDEKIFSHLENIFLSSHTAGVYQTLDDEILSFEKTVLTDYLNLSNSQFEVKYNGLNLKQKLI
ncbi:MAG: hypothetical protein HN509_17235 [Halobacteriovoraceae bacterium]|nr:hypothetical protein [Halobacteriovoraceae bacterium]MBT5094899.1 hypothetical protein [Halobacteriovoraceae bacterium]